MSEPEQSAVTSEPATPTPTSRQSERIRKAAQSAEPAEPGSARPRAYEQGYPWNLNRVPKTASVRGRLVVHPARESAIFVVHGIGAQKANETAAALRSGFEDALERIAVWQREAPHDVEIPADRVPPPFCFDGNWSNYEKLEETFAEDWEKFCEREREFFASLWLQRSSTIRTYFWFLWQQLRLLSWRVFLKSPALWLLYVALQPVAFIALTVALVLRRKVISAFLQDVRVYLAPRGIYERAVVQRIDHRVGQQFLSLLGLDWDFRQLPWHDRLLASGEHVSFERIIWVAHSLGTVISFNVLSDLFQRAAHIDAEGDAEQRQGVARFRNGLRRFITLGSPLDKVAFLFGEHVLRPWPKLAPRASAADERVSADPPSEFWVNFFNVLDPVSGSLSEPLVVGDRPPLNLHSAYTSAGLLPGLAHNAYWSDDAQTLRYVIGRTYGRQYLEDRPFRSLPPWLLSVLPLAAYLTWASLLLGTLWALVTYRAELLDALWNGLKSLL